MSKEEIKKKLVEAIEKDPHKEDIIKASIFGSYAYGEPHPDSDIDVLVEFRPNARIGLFEYVQIQRNFSDYCGKKIDLLTPEGLSKYFRDEVLAKAETFYEK
ncbi:MAG: nucleotidyltransferase family protein [Parcubacteria group bacterium]|jgi:hypothetical protein